jgi:hypothetical protein
MSRSEHESGHGAGGGGHGHGGHGGHGHRLPYEDPGYDQPVESPGAARQLQVLTPLPVR